MTRPIGDLRGPVGEAVGRVMTGMDTHTLPTPPVTKPPGQTPEKSSGCAIWIPTSVSGYYPTRAIRTGRPRILGWIIVSD